MSQFARLLGRALAPGLRAARYLLWRPAGADADRSSRFRTAAEQSVWVEAMEVRRAAAERSASLDAERRVLLRRADAADAAAGAAAAAEVSGGNGSGGGGGSGSERSAAPDTPVTIAGIESTSFFLIWGTAATLPVLLYAALCEWASARAREAGSDAASGDARLTNRKVLDARIEAIEQQLAAEATAARAAVPAPAAAHGALAPVTAAPVTAAAAAAAFESSFLAGVASELARRREAMLKPPLPPHAAPPPVDALARLEARLAAVEAAQLSVATPPLLHTAASST